MTLTVTALTSTARYRIDIVADGHVVVADQPLDQGGGNLGASPFALVMAGLAACTANTLRLFAEGRGWGDLAIAVELGLDLGPGRGVVRRRVCINGLPDAAALAALRVEAEQTPLTLALKAGFDIETSLRSVPVPTV